jgi:hypothetical protein
MPNHDLTAVRKIRRGNQAKAVNLKTDNTKAKRKVQKKINDLGILDIHRCKITKDYRKRKATCLLLLIGNERWTTCSSPLSFISLIHNPLILPSVFFLSRALNNLLRPMRQSIQHM